MSAEILLIPGLLAGGALAGLLSRWAPLSGWAALAFALVLPPLGIGLARLFCWAHPLAWLGPSILLSSPPFSTGYAYHACRRAKARRPARIALALAGAELLFLIALLVAGAVAETT